MCKAEYICVCAPNVTKCGEECEYFCKPLELPPRVQTCLLPRFWGFITEAQALKEMKIFEPHTAQVGCWEFNTE